MSDVTITIVGTGVIGASMGLALKQQSDPPYLVGHDKELANAKAAAKMGAFDKTEWNLINACEQANIVILAVPVSGIQPTLEAIAPYLKEGVVISDTTRSKVPTLAWAKELLPKHAYFVGGNPVVYPPEAGYKNASANLFKGKLYCLTPAASANEEAVQLMVSFVSLLGAQPFFLDAAEHDGLITATEHLPNLLSTALIDTLTKQDSWRETRKLAGGLFARVSSGADGDPDALASNFRENSQTLVHWLDRYMVQLQALRTMLLAEDDENNEVLAKKMDKTIVARLNWLKDLEKGDFSDPELAPVDIETPGFLTQMIGFGRFRKRDSDSSKK